MEIGFFCNMNLVTHKAFAAWRYANFRLYMVARLTLTMGIIMQSVITGWMVYLYTKDAFMLGLTGLAEAIPAIAVGLYAGYLADKYHRKKIILTSLLFLILSSVCITYINFHEQYYYTKFGVVPLFAFTFCVGISRGFLASATNAMSAGLVPLEVLPNMISWNTTAWYIGAIAGPAIGGIVYNNYNAGYVSLLYTLLMVIAFVSYVFLKIPAATHTLTQSWFLSFKEGVVYLKQNKILLGAITLDLLAVMFGDAIVLLPAFAATVLNIDAATTGWLRAAPAVGSIVMATWLAFHPPVNNTGRKLLFSVACFGFAMIAFGLSHSFMLTYIILAFAGMFDTVSVIVRNIILQTTTHNSMRGRVASINSIFIGSSNEIGAFVAGSMAKMFTLQASVVLGGCITVFVVLLMWRIVPELKKYNQLEKQ